jgi:hypothetical protein
MRNLMIKIGTCPRKQRTSGHTVWWGGFGGMVFCFRGAGLEVFEVLVTGWDYNFIDTGGGPQNR